MTNNNENLEKKTVINVYAAFGVGLLLSLFPSMTAAGLSLLFIAGVLIAAYIIRKKHEDGSLTENHMTFIVRTIWIAGFLSGVTMIPSVIYMLTTIDNSPLESCVNTLLSGADPATAIKPCIPNFIQTNMNTLIVSAVILAGPILLYLAVRYVRGLSRAIKGYRIANVKGWF